MPSVVLPSLRHREPKEHIGTGREVVVRWKLAILSICLLLVVGCASKADVTANDSDNGRSIQLNRGQILDIVVADDFERSRCQWRDEQKYDVEILEYLGARYEPGRTSPGAAGGGTYTSRYRAAAAGTVRVTLALEDNANPPRVVKRFLLDVTVL
jgi:hypothetical protein